MSLWLPMVCKRPITAPAILQGSSANFFCVQHASFAIRSYLMLSGRDREAARLNRCLTSQGVDHYFSTSCAVLRAATKPTPVSPTQPFTPLTICCFLKNKNTNI